MSIGFSLRLTPRAQCPMGSDIVVSQEFFDELYVQILFLRSSQVEDRQIQNLKHTGVDVFGRGGGSYTMSRSPSCLCEGQYGPEVRLSACILHESLDCPFFDFFVSLFCLWAGVAQKTLSLSVFWRKFPRLLSLSG